MYALLSTLSTMPMIHLMRLRELDVSSGQITKQASCSRFSSRVVARKGRNEPESLRDKQGIYSLSTYTYIYIYIYTYIYHIYSCVIRQFAINSTIDFALVHFAGRRLYQL